jgi:NitT/TauT family transport system permease protein
MAIATKPDPRAPLRPRRRGAGARAFALLRPQGELSTRAYVVVAVVAFAGLFVTWALAAFYDLADDLFLPSPAQVVSRGIELAAEGTLWPDARDSFVRISVGFLASAALAVPIGVLMGCYRWAEAGIEPTLEFVRYMPVAAFVPLTIIWVGLEEDQKYLVIFLGTFFTQALMVMNVVRRVPGEQIDAALTFGMSGPKILRRVIVPSAGPGVWDTLRITLGWAWTWVVLAELIAAESGLGYRILTAQRNLQTDTIFACIIVIGLLGLVMDQLMRLAAPRLFPGQERAR